MQSRADYEQQRLHLMRKHGIGLEDDPQGDGSRTKRLDRKCFEALMGGNGRSAIFTLREKNSRKVRIIVVPCTCQLAYSVYVQYDLRFRVPVAD